MHLTQAMTTTTAETRMTLTLQSAARTDLGRDDCSDLERAMLTSLADGPYAEPTAERDVIEYARRVAQTAEHAVELRRVLEQVDPEPVID